MSKFPTTTPEFEELSKKYQDILFNSKLGEPGRKYLANRGISKDTAIAWEMGYCPIGWKNDRSHSKMAGRVTFPIRDQNGIVISISGRTAIPEAQGPKYDHYPFPARRTLFGYWQNRRTIRSVDEAIITEGQLDVIMDWQNGLKIAVSTFGAHLSLDHIAILSRSATNINICYDKDAAGIEGAKMVDELSTLGDVNVKKVFLPNNEDLDSFLRKHGVEKLKELLKGPNKTDRIKNKLKKLERKLNTLK